MKEAHVFDTRENYKRIKSFDENFAQKIVDYKAA